MYTYLIQSKDQKKLQLFQYLLFSKDGRNIHNIEEELSIKQYTIRRYLKEITNDISIIFDKEIVSIKNDKKRLNILTKDSISNDYVVTSLHSFYIRNGPLSRILTYLTANSANSIIELAQSLNYSESTIYKMMSDLLDMLKLFDLTLDLKSHELSKFKGDEFNIRYFLYLIILNLYYADGEEKLTRQVPSEFIDYNHIQQTLNFEGKISYSQKKKLTLIYGIASYRLVYIKKSMPIQNDFFNDSKFFYNNIPSLNLKSFNVDKNTIKNESHILSVMTHVLIAGGYSFNQKSIIVNKYLNSGLQISKDIKMFIERFKRELNISYTYDQYIDIFYLLLLYVIRLNYFKLKNDSFQLHPVTEENYKTPEDSLNYQKVSNILKNLSVYLPLNFEISQMNKIKISYFLYFIYEMQEVNMPLKIYITHIDLSIVTLIKNILGRFYNERIIEFCIDSDSADFLISNRYENRKDKPIFVFNDIYNKKYWNQLIKSVSNAIIHQYSIDM